MTKRTMPLEEALSSLYQQVEPDQDFTRGLQEKLLTQASRSGERPRSSRGFKPGLRAAGWAAAGMIALLIFAWAINTLIAGSAPSNGKHEHAVPASHVESPIPATRVPEPSLSPAIRNPVRYTVKSGDTLESIAEESGTPVEIIIALNNIDDETVLIHGTELIVGFASPSPSPVQSDFEAAPISMLSSSDEIRQCLRGSDATWNTLWANALLTTTSKGVEHVDREQVWLQQGASRWLTGRINEEPSLLWLENKDGAALIDLDSGEIQQFELSSRFPSQLEDLLFPTRIASRGGEFRPYRVEATAGQEAVAVEWTDSENQLIDRFWIDTERCVILRWVHLAREYAQASGEVLPMEVTITAIVYDEAFSPLLFALESSLSLDFVEELEAP
jgi:LysM repeat protein